MVLLFAVLILFFVGSMNGIDLNVYTNSIHVSSNEPPDFVFGVSTGHVGSTSFSDRRLYSLPHVLIMFEGHYQNQSILSYTTTSKWKASNHSHEMEFVESVYIPFLLAIRKQRTTLMDLGHNNLYFLEALIKYFAHSKRYRATFVRIRRDRYESARSLSYSTPEKELTSICGGLWFRYCPLDRKEDVILKPPSVLIWRSFTIMQQAFWLIDEVEARWLKALKHHPNIDRAEVYWSKEVDGMFDEAASTIGIVLGKTTTVHFHESWDKKTHANNDSSISSLLPDMIRQDELYHRLMNSNGK